MVEIRLSQGMDYLIPPPTCELGDSRFADRPGLGFRMRSPVWIFE
ncbi:MAG: hypothetical protein A07HR60_01769 [uncultured archaeon A07HR60]|jgi:hypothetical protein|nr:MAG: hypothetical protein A07HR60_01769 [uncultured archaeon A07HR60]